MIRMMSRLSVVFAMACVAAPSAPVARATNTPVTLARANPTPRAHAKGDLRFDLQDVEAQQIRPVTPPQGLPGVVPTCPAGRTACLDARTRRYNCSDLRHDDHNCGSCGHACLPGNESCIDGACGPN